MDYNFEKKVKNNNIVIAILYDTNEYKSALLLQNEILNRYQNHLKNYTLKTIVVPYSKVKQVYANLYYLLPTKNSNIQKVVKKAEALHALTFAYSSHDLKRGIMLSLKIGAKIKPIINLSAVKNNNITFRPVLLKISHIYTQEENSKQLPKSNNCYKNKMNISYYALREL